MIAEKKIKKTEIHIKRNLEKYLWSMYIKRFKAEKSMKKEQPDESGAVTPGIPDG